MPSDPHRTVKPSPQILANQGHLALREPVALKVGHAGKVKP